MKLRFTEKFDEDLSLIEESQKGNSTKIITDILNSLKLLKTFPYMGPELERITGRVSEYRYLVCANYVVLYRIEVEMISIIRLFDARSDYIDSLLY